jgi:pyrimidine operon attenuation protein / uracil phosphoribosyltransferase
MRIEILNHNEILHKTKRIAFQIYETLVDEEEIIIAGISKSGFEFAKKIAENLSEITAIKINICEVVVNKQNPREEIKISLKQDDLNQKAIVLVDDVLNSGTTLIYATKFLLNFNITKLKTAVLVDRNHKKFPIKADFKGISLSTSLQEHVQVVFEENNFHAYLS